MSFTPGPWKWEGDLADGECYLASEYGNGGVITASGMHTEGYIYVSEGDARLISKAPELYGLLRSILTNEDAMEQARKSSALGLPSEWQYDRKQALRDEARSLLKEVGG